MSFSALKLKCKKKGLLAGLQLEKNSIINYNNNSKSMNLLFFNKETVPK